MQGKPGHGGSRPGAGRKPAPKAPALPLDVVGGSDPLKFLVAVMDDVEAEPALRVRAAIAAVQYTHAKIGEGGKKDAANKAAQAVGAGKFGARPPPLKLIAGG